MKGVHVITVQRYTPHIFPKADGWTVMGDKTLNVYDGEQIVATFLDEVWSAAYFSEASPDASAGAEEADLADEIRKINEAIAE